MKVTHKHKETLYISAITYAFLNQKRVNACEHTVMMVRRLYQVFTYIYSLLIKKGIYDNQNISSFRVFLCDFYPEISFIFQ
jgi:hypothetical protein